jgi:hypothetical protein
VIEQNGHETLAATSVRNTASPDLETGTLLRTLISSFKASLRLISNFQSSRYYRWLAGLPLQTMHHLCVGRRRPPPQTRRHLCADLRRTLCSCPFECPSASESFGSG